MEDPKEIARKLTKAQRALLVGDTQHLPQHEVVALIDQGLAHLYVARGGRYGGLTDAGLAVREALLTPTREDQSND